MLRALFVCVRNLIYYRKARFIDKSFLSRFKRHHGDLAEIKRAFTDAMLATVGLKTVDTDKETIAWYILLSQTQRSWIKTVSAFGYKVGLR